MKKGGWIMKFYDDNKEKIDGLINAAKMGANDFFGVVNGKREELVRNAKDLKEVKANDLLAAVKLNELVKKEDEEPKKKNPILVCLAVIGAIAAVAGIAFAVYKYFTPDYLEDFDDDPDFDDDDDLFEEDE